MPSTERETLKRAAAAGLAWPLDDDVSDAALEAALYQEPGNKTGYATPTLASAASGSAAMS